MQQFVSHFCLTAEDGLAMSNSQKCGTEARGEMFPKHNPPQTSIIVVLIRVAPPPKIRSHYIAFSTIKKDSTTPKSSTITSQTSIPNFQICCTKHGAHRQRSARLAYTQIQYRTRPARKSVFVERAAIAAQMAVLCCQSFTP